MDTFELLRQLCEQDFIGGLQDAAGTVEQLLRPYVDQVERLPDGSVLGRLGDDGPGTLLEAHIDQVGLVVTQVYDDGFLSVAKCGGPDIRALPAASVTIHGRKNLPGVFYSTPPHLRKREDDALPELDKVLYMDSDVMVLHDLNQLYQTDISGQYLAAVKDPSWFFENMHVVELNLEQRGFYFNSGVMLMNLQKIREDNLVAKLEDYTNNNFRTYMDQDALNVVVGDKVALLPFENNAMNFFFKHVDLAKMGEFYGREWKTYEEVFAPATIVHFASSQKPLGTVVPKTDFFYMLQKLWYKYYTPLPPLAPIEQ